MKPHSHRHRRGWHSAANGARGRTPARLRPVRFSWGEIRLVLLGGILAGLSVAAMPDEWRSGQAIAALPDRVADVVTGNAPSAAPETADVPHPRFSRCTGPVRTHCVVDGDTFWMGGEKIRIADLNAPEVSSPRCAAEARLGARATDALIVQLNAGPFALAEIDRDEDRYGRKLRRVMRDGQSVGGAMVGAGVARWYDRGPRGWCG